MEDNYYEDYQDEVKLLEKITGELMEKEKRRTLKLARKSAKCSKKVNKLVYIKRDIEKLKEIENKGYGFPNKEINEILAIAYKNSVTSFHNIAEKYFNIDNEIYERNKDKANNNYLRFKELFNNS